MAFGHKYVCLYIHAFVSVQYVFVSPHRLPCEGIQSQSVDAMKMGALVFLKAKSSCGISSYLLVWSTACTIAIIFALLHFTNSSQHIRSTLSACMYACMCVRMFACI